MVIWLSPESPGLSVFHVVIKGLDPSEQSVALPPSVIVQPKSSISF